MIGVPICYEMYPIMKLWLGIVPNYAPEFCVFLMVTSLFNLINSVLSITIHATGNIKLLSFFSGSIYLLSVPVVYIIFRFFSHEAILAYVVSLISMILVVCSNAFIVKHYIASFSIGHFVKYVLSAFLLAGLAFPSLLISNLVDNNVAHIIVSFVSYIFVLAILTYFLGLEKETRSRVNDYVLRFLKRK
jgi:hypothetical protein